jgi:hypothetical protein
MRIRIKQKTKWIQMWRDKIEGKKNKKKMVEEEKLK